MRDDGQGRRRSESQLEMLSELVSCRTLEHLRDELLDVEPVHTRERTREFFQMIGKHR